MADSHEAPPSSSRSRASGASSETLNTSLPASVARPSTPSTSSTPSQSPSRATVPPSEPRSASRTSFNTINVSGDRPARLQNIVILILLLVLVAIPLYLWRRPRAESIAAGSAADAGVDPAAMAPPPTLQDETKPSIGEARSLLCQDPGSKKTAPEQCDHVVDVEKALAKAIEDSASCVPREAGGGTIQYVADISFKRKAIGITTPKDTRTMKNTKVVAACQHAVKTRLQSLALEGVTHAHARYKIAITAGYPGPPK